MKITITFELKATGKKYDVQVSGKQKIQDTLQVLGENIKDFSERGKIEVLRDKDTGRKILVGHTYEEENVYSGRELVV